MSPLTLIRRLRTRLSMQEMRVRSLGWENPLEEGMTTHSNILGWRIPMDREALQALQDLPSGRKESDMTERLSTEHSAYCTMPENWCCFKTLFEDI